MFSTQWQVLLSGHLGTSQHLVRYIIEAVSRLSAASRVTMATRFWLVQEAEQWGWDELSVCDCIWCDGDIYLLLSSERERRWWHFWRNLLPHVLIITRRSAGSDRWCDASLAQRANKSLKFCVFVSRCPFDAFQIDINMCLWCQRWFQGSPCLCYVLTMITAEHCFGFGVVLGLVYGTSS